MEQEDPRLLHDLSDLLKRLPPWNDQSSRVAFVEQALGHEHRVLSRMSWGGSPADIAWELAKTCKAFANSPVAHRPGLSALCALLAHAADLYADYEGCGPRIADLQHRLRCPGQEPEVDYDCEPYRGMDAFDLAHAPIFFGRETETDELLAKLAGAQGSRLVLVAGRSGSGKSSLVRAGLWARLLDAERTPIPGSAQWIVTAMKPDELGDGDPFMALIDSLRVAKLRGLTLRDLKAEARALQADADAFAALHRRVLNGRPDAQWLLIVDQLEELFCSVKEGARAAFLDRLLAALDLARFRVVATVRSDFLDHCIAHPGLRAELKTDGSQYPVGAPNAAALEKMIAGPLRERVLRPEYRATIDDALVHRLAQDASGRAGGLPLLAFALKDLYDGCRNAVADGERTEPRMRLDDYLSQADAVPGESAPATDKPLVGLDRVIADRAVAAANRAGVDTDRVLPRVFSRLLTVAADGAATRLREDLAHWREDPEALALIAALSAPDTRLLVLDARHHGTAIGAAEPGDAARGRVVEVAHEALFHAWPALAGWIERRKEALIRRPHLGREVARWDEAGRPDHQVPNPHLVKELRTLLEEAELWSDMVGDDPRLAHFLIRDDPAELLDLTLKAHAAQAQEPRARAHLLHTLTRRERGSGSLSALVADLRERDARQGSDIAGWLRAGIDIDAFFGGADAARWHWHRVAVGDLLDALGDPREGIGVDAHGLPAMVWMPVPAGRFYYPEWEEEQERETDAFRIALYPVTNRQFRAFTEAGDEEYRDPRWWQPWGFDPAAKSPWPQDNRPCVAVSWREAVAFCRWLTERLRAKGLKDGGIGPEEEIRLPTEAEWVKAARGTDRRPFPWGEDYRGGDANIDETYAVEGVPRVGDLNLGQTAAVGLYPRNRSPYGLMDCSGNVWEWCLNKFDDVDNVGLEGDEARGVRGGSWLNNQAAARVSARTWLAIDVRLNTLGFRVCRVGPLR